MAVAYQSTTTSGWGSTDTPTANKPSGLALGDIMIAYLYSVTGFSGITPPVDWTSYGFTTIGSGDGAAFYYYKIAESSDVSAIDYTFTLVNPEKCILNLIRIDGGDINPLNWQSSGNDKIQNNTATPAIAAGVTPSANSLLVQFWSAANAVGSIGTYAIVTSNPSWTEIYDVADSTDRCVSAAYGNRPEATATGNVSAAGGAGTTDWGVMMIAIPPSSAPAPTGNAMFMGAEF